MVTSVIAIKVDSSPLTTLVLVNGKPMLPMLQCGMNTTTIFNIDSWWLYPSNK
jgi:hypothetical protein